MARKSRKNVIPQESTALPDKEKKVLFKAGLYARLSHEKEAHKRRVCQAFKGDGGAD